MQISKSRIKKLIRGNLFMRILAMDRFLPGTTMEKIQPHLKDEMKIAWDHYKQGKMREMYFRQDGQGVVLMLECDSLKEAQEVIDELPLVKEKLVEFDLTPLGPFVPLEILFNP